MIARDPSVGTVCNDAGMTAELIPNGNALAVGGRGTLDLECTAGNAPRESRREAIAEFVDVDLR